MIPSWWNPAQILVCLFFTFFLSFPDLTIRHSHATDPIPAADSVMIVTVHLESSGYIYIPRLLYH